MGFDDRSAQVRNIRDPGQPTVKEHQEHMTLIEGAFSSSTCLHVLNVDKRFVFCAQPMPHDMVYPSPSCPRTNA